MRKFFIHIFSPLQAYSYISFNINVAPSTFSHHIFCLFFSLTYLKYVIIQTVYLELRNAIEIARIIALCVIWNHEHMCDVYSAMLGLALVLSLHGLDFKRLLVTVHFSGSHRSLGPTNSRSSPLSSLKGDLSKCPWVLRVNEIICYLERYCRSLFV